MFCNLFSSVQPHGFKGLSTQSLLNTSHMFTAATQSKTACLVGFTMHRMQILTLRGLWKGPTLAVQL